MALVSLKKLRESLKLKGHPPVTRETIYSLLRRLKKTGEKPSIKPVLKMGGKPKRQRAYFKGADASRIRKIFMAIHWRQNA